MKELLFAGAAIGALMTAPAFAADMGVRPVMKAPIAPLVYSWTGFYIGAHVGGAWGTKDWFDPGDSFNLAPTPFGFPLGSHDLSGIIAGGQIGVNWQAPGSSWVLGLEGEASWTNADGSHVLEDVTFRTKVNWLGTVTGRLGYAFDRMLVYVKGGFAFADDEHDASFSEEFFSAEKTRTGWTIGGGLEIALGGNWSAKGEYNFMDFGNKAVTFSDGSDSFPLKIDQQIHVVKFGINYRLGPSPVVGRY